MAVQLAAQGDVNKPPRRRFKLPDAVPPFGRRTHRLFSAVWIAALLLAVIGPAMGLYQRYSNPGDNSQLMLGSRAGIAVSAADATRIRFAVGPETVKAGIEAGDHIVAIYGLPLPRQMPISEKLLAEKADDPAYMAMGNLLLGTEAMEVPLTVRATDGAVREVTITTSEQHINLAVARQGITPLMLGFVDLIHVIFYPFLIWAAWILHRRNPRDSVSSILSLAILLIIGAEQPSSGFLAATGVPRSVNVLLYDAGNICLLAGILLFPHGKLSPRLVVLLAALPLLMLFHGPTYQAVFVMFMLLAVLMLVGCLRQTAATDLRQQIRWALFGFSGYAVFRILSIAADLYKPSTSTFPAQLFFEVFAGLSLGLAMLVLQLGLLVALLRFRLYDAESIISRTASVAIVTLALGAVAAGVMEGIITQMQNIYDDSQTPAAVIGAVMATMFIHPLHERVQKWAERRFHKNLLELREGLPEAMRDLRDVATVDDFLSDVLQRVATGVHATKAAVVLGREVRQSLNVPTAEVLRWLVTHDPAGEAVLECRADDKLFPLRVTLESSSSGTNSGFVLVGPRPDGSIAGKDEQEVLEQIAPSLSRSIRIALNRERRQAEFDSLMQSHQTRIGRIERLLKL
ncbi:MAG: hypothetical protein M3428_06295 [Pseudomonadota bacterium]|nr:hypothetical protein [Pseudomonadota bacterium]